MKYGKPPHGICCGAVLRGTALVSVLGAVRGLAVAAIEVFRHHGVRACTPERGKVRSYSGASPPAESVLHPGKRKNKKFQWCFVASRVRCAPRKKKKQEVSVVLRHRVGRLCTPEKEKTRSFSGASPPRREAMHPGKGKLKKFQW